jgi:beta-lactamase class A
MIGQKESISALVYDMITYSGNLATNLIIEFVGPQNVQRTVDALGASGMRVLRGVEDIKAYRAGKSNTTTAMALTRIFTAILEGESAGPQSTRKMIDILLKQKFNDKLPGLLPDDVRVAHKTGSITAINHDSGIIYPPKKDPYVLTVLTRGFDDPENARKCIAVISKMIYDRVVE